ncbi:Aminoacyl-tRNA synthetase, class Ia, partial [Dillenia turbinata]
MALSSPSLLSPCCFQFHRLNPLLLSHRHRLLRVSPFLLNRPRPRFFAVAAAENGVFTSPEIAKSFDFTSEERIYNCLLPPLDWYRVPGMLSLMAWATVLKQTMFRVRWEYNGYFKPNFDRGSDPFVISMPPPNVTGSLHMGHAMFVTLEDILVRYHRMKGRPTLWLPGTDHAGIATQLVVERMLASEGVKRTDLSREEFTKRVWEWKEKYGGTITNQIRRLGASCDWSREHFTLDEQLSRAVIEAFVRLHDKGLIYQGSYMVNWSPILQTAVSDLEVEYSEEPGTLYYIRYRVAGGSSGTICGVLSAETPNKTTPLADGVGVQASEIDRVAPPGEAPVPDDDILSILNWFTEYANLVALDNDSFGNVQEGNFNGVVGSEEHDIYVGLEELGDLTELNNDPLSFSRWNEDDTSRWTDPYNDM